jgi:hypothetical protein
MFLHVRLFAILSIVGLVFASTAFAAEEAEAEPEEKEVVFTQGQLAVAIVRALGLEDQVGFDQTVQGYILFLAGRGISPLPHWDANAPVDKETLAVVVVKTLGLMTQVRNVDNAGDYIRVLEERDIAISATEDVRRVLSNIFVVNTLTEIVGAGGGGTPLTPTTGL